MGAPADVTGPSLRQYGEPVHATGAVLMLHGGKEHGHETVDGRSASWRRSAAMARAIAPDLQAAGVAVWLLRYRRRGWNGGAGPVGDARWALEQVRDRLRSVPVVLVGHSMGARIAVRVADDAQVRGVVALAPWFPPGESVAPLAGKALVAAHGSRDRITSAGATRAYVERARAAGIDASYVDMGPVGHYLLRGVRGWNDLALTGSRRLLGN
ncbi:alpha/beta hydrolase [Nocardioides sp.]|uniref:alpha/beta hydrolase n=1 Tax=Nocardioides sp. TaxID=35761 RepID=UPI002ED10EC0